MFPGIAINNTNETTLSTPTVASETGENTIHNLGLRYTPCGSEEWSRMVENGLKPALGLILCSLKEREFQKNLRTLNLYIKQTIVNYCKRNIGATKTFKILAEQSNGYANIGASLTEFKNFKRNIKCYIGDKEADMFLDYLKGLSKSQDGFYFAHEVDEDNYLARIFWGDAQTRINYSFYGDTITFDPTYGTNKYHMALTPFTGVDNHKKSVTFAAALVDHENDGSFIWVFKKFLDCMGNKEPQFILTDQVPTIKLGVRSLFGILPWNPLSLKKNGLKVQWNNNAIIRDFLMLQVTARCHIGFPEKGNMDIMGVEDAYRKGRIFQVAHNNESKETTCTCKMFERKGILCKHIIWIISGKGLHSIPEQYIESRWTKKSYRKPLYGLDEKLLQDYDPTDLRKFELSRVWSEFYATISVINSMPQTQIKELSLMLLQFREKINPTKESLTKEHKLEMLLGCSAKSNITVLLPKIANIKEVARE
ncbi:protein FAR1-RELATED SEQUENCE 2-like [Silene latifolia]|uniref:protein FAR1-RELATED SEQUENCE 2-like n=1 Tax=Silene latifolia TaxID=37657 RepID=UPI003D77E00D